MGWVGLVLAGMIGILAGAALTALILNAFFQKKERELSRSLREAVDSAAAIKKERERFSRELSDLGLSLEENAKAADMFAEKTRAAGEAVIAQSDRGILAIKEGEREEAAVNGMREELIYSLKEISDAVGTACGMFSLPESIHKEMEDAERTVKFTAGEIESQAAAAERAAADLKELAESISELAEQADLLALNASIEAAKLPKEDKGFFAVSSELRALSKECGRVHENIVGVSEKISRCFLQGREQAKQLQAAAGGQQRCFWELFALFEENDRELVKLSKKIEAASLQTEALFAKKEAAADLRRECAAAVKETAVIGERLHEEELKGIAEGMASNAKSLALIADQLQGEHI